MYLVLMQKRKFREMWVYGKFAILVGLSFLAVAMIASQVVADSFSDSRPAQLIATALEIHLLMTGLHFHLQWRYVTGNHRFVDPSLSSFIIRRGSEITLIIPVLSCVGLVLAFLFIPYGVVVYILVPLLYYIRLKRIQ
jgi:hypothetical protein